MAGGLSTGTCLAADRGEGFGGYIGFGGGSVLVHEMEVGYYTGSNWATDVKENFALSVGGTAAGMAITLPPRPARRRLPQEVPGSRRRGPGSPTAR